MNFRTTYILFGLLAILFGVVALVLFLGPSPSKGEGYVFPSAHEAATKLEARDFTRVIVQSLRPAEDEIVLERSEGEGWQVVKPRELLADTSSVSGLLSSILSARVDKDVKPRGKKEAGLDRPTRVLVLVGKDRELKLTLGDTTPLDRDALVFVESSDRPGEILAVKKDDLRGAQEPLSYFRGKDLLGETADLTSIKLTMGKKPPVELKKDKGGWRYVTPAYGEADASSLTSALAGLSVMHVDDKLSDFVKDGVPAEKWADYHLDPARADVLRVEVTHEKGKPTAALIGVSKKDGEKFYAAAVQEGKTLDVVKVQAANVEPLTSLLDNPSNLRNKSLVRLENVSPDAINVQNDYGLLELRKPPREFDWKLYRDGQAHKVDPGEMRLLIDSINKKGQVVDFPNPDRKKELGLEKPDYTVTIWADSLESPEDRDGKDKKDDKDKKDKKDGKPAFRKGAEPVAVLKFGNVEGGRVAILREWGKESDIVMVPASPLRDAVKKRPLDYYDRTLPRFNDLAAEENVTKLELTRGSEVVELGREKATGPFTFVKPDSLKGRKANEAVVRDILDQLNRITAREIAGEKADSKDLSGKYGLDPAGIRAVVTLTKDGKPSTHSFDLGKAADKGVYARLGGNPMVYVVEASLADTLKKELRDTAAVEFDPDKVESVTIKGWGKDTGEALTLAAEKSGGKWVMKSPASFALDAEKLSAFLGKLSKLQAEKFIPAAKIPPLDKGGFQVVLTLADKSSIELNVGPEEGGSLPATSSQMKGESFTVPRDVFAEPMARRVYFQK
jgi:hypothetical protein